MTAKARQNVNSFEKEASISSCPEVREQPREATPQYAKQPLKAKQQRIDALHKENH